MIKIDSNVGLTLDNASLVFGTEKKSIRALIGEPANTVTRESGDLYDNRELYSRQNLMLHYNREDKLEFIEIFPQRSVFIDDYEVDFEKYSDLKEFMNRKTNDWSEESDGAKSKKFGVGVYISGFEKEQREDIENISVFVKNYYS